MELKQLEKKITILQKELDEAQCANRMLKEELVRCKRVLTEPELQFRLNTIITIAVAITLITAITL